MKEIRPSTWVTLAILALLIFVPAFFVDVDTLTPPANSTAPGDNSVRPVNPLGNEDSPPPRNTEPAKPPANDGAAAPGNEPTPME